MVTGHPERRPDLNPGLWGLCWLSPSSCGHWRVNQLVNTKCVYVLSLHFGSMKTKFRRKIIMPYQFGVLKTPVALQSRQWWSQSQCVTHVHPWILSGLLCSRSLQNLLLTFHGLVNKQYHFDLKRIITHYRNTGLHSEARPNHHFVEISRRSEQPDHCNTTCWKTAQ